MTLQFFLLLLIFSFETIDDKRGVAWPDLCVAATGCVCVTGQPKTTSDQVVVLNYSLHLRFICSFGP
uniref:Putative secreted protein n=1 Tax=Anopheles triannulatus TaxID=58253 RepID=A0A2M4B6Q0_9DIPT